MGYRIEISKNLAVWIHREGERKPFFHQPNRPNGTSWANYEEAWAWAKGYVESLTPPPEPAEPDPIDNLQAQIDELTELILMGGI